MRSMLAAGKYAGIAGLSGLAGAAAGSAMFEAQQDALPVYDQRLTEAQHARDNAAFAIQSGERPEDYAMFEGIRQGLIGGAIQPIDVNRMIIEGQLSPRAEVLVSDIHDGSAQDLHTNPRMIAQMVSDMGGDGNSYLMEQQTLREQMGINVPI